MGYHVLIFTRVTSFTVAMQSLYSPQKAISRYIHIYRQQLKTLNVFLFDIFKLQRIQTGHKKSMRLTHGMTRIHWDSAMT